MKGINRVFPVRFRVCDSCGRHGWIFFRDGSSSTEAFSKDAAYCLMEDALADGRLHQEEVPDLMDQIEESGLVDFESSPKPATVRQ